MVLDNIEQLLEKYENAETTLQEEQQLKHYFTNETVAPHLEVYKPMFAYFLNTQSEEFTKDIPLQPKTKTTLYKWISVAAVAVLMLGMYFSTGPIFGETQKTFATLTPEEKRDYNQAMDALNLLSTTFKKGTDNISAITTLSDSFNKGQENLAYLGEFDNQIDKIFK